MSDVLVQYLNGNTQVTLYSDGTRTLEYESELKLEYPLNVDIRVSTSCSFGKRPDGSVVLCDFCHEGAVTEGVDCNYELLFNLISELPAGTELAIGCNELTEGLFGFLNRARSYGYVPNITVNQGHCRRDCSKILEGISLGCIKGLGISYRESLPFNIPKELLEYPNTVLHVIAGIDNVDNVLALKDKGINKLLILGEKDFGFNSGSVIDSDLDPWRWKLPLFPGQFQVVSFDNLALEQLKVERLFVNKTDFNTFNQGEHSFYIDAANGFVAPSSRSPMCTSLERLSATEPLKTYFSKLSKLKVLL